jgi:tryptophan-rich sensory protein
VKKKVDNKLSYLFFIGVLFTISYFLCLFTKQTNFSWSANLNRPSFALPSYISTFMWGLIYIVLGWVSATSWSLEKSAQRSRLLNHIYVQIALNFLWLILFYSFRSLTLSVLDSAIIFIGSIYLGILIHKLDKKVFYPYLIYMIWMFYELALGIFRYFLNR